METNTFTFLLPSLFGVLGTIVGTIVGGLISRRTNKALSLSDRRIDAFCEYMDAFSLISVSSRENKLRFYAAHNKALLVASERVRIELKRTFDIVIKASKTNEWKLAINAVNALFVLMADDVSYARLSGFQKLKRHLRRNTRDHANPPPFLSAGGGDSGKETGAKR